MGEFLHLYGPSIPFISKVVAYTTSCFDLNDVYSDKSMNQEDEIIESIGSIGSIGVQNYSFLTSLALVLLYPFEQSLHPMQSILIHLFSPPLTSSVQKLLDVVIQTGILVHLRISFHSIEWYPV